jgi:hypothetical protein
VEFAGLGERVTDAEAAREPLRRLELAARIAGGHRCPRENMCCAHAADSRSEHECRVRAAGNATATGPLNAAAPYPTSRLIAQ